MSSRPTDGTVLKSTWIMVTLPLAGVLGAGLEAQHFGSVPVSRLAVTSRPGHSWCQMALYLFGTENTSSVALSVELHGKSSKRLLVAKEDG